MMLLRLMSGFPTLKRTIPVFEWVLKQQGAYSENMDGGPPGGGLFMSGDSVNTATADTSDASISTTNNNATVEDAAKDLSSPAANTDGNTTELPQELESWLDDFDGMDYFNNLYLTSFL